MLTQTTTLDDCIGLCAAYDEANKTSIAGGADYVCNAVCWRNGFVNDDYPGTGSFQTTGQSICDGAGWSDQRQLAQWRCGIDERELEEMGHWVGYELGWRMELVGFRGL